MKYYLYALIILLIDQVTKWIIVDRLMLGESRSVIGEFFQITSHRNRGAAFGILQDQRWFFIVITTVVIVGVIWYMQKLIKESKALLPFALSLLLGGALGNFIDRVRSGEVVDFFDFHFRFDLLGWPVDYPFPIFNVADSAIVVGVILIFLESFMSWGQESRMNRQREAEQRTESGDMQP